MHAGRVCKRSHAAPFTEHVYSSVAFSTMAVLGVVWYIVDTLKNGREAFPVTMLHRNPAPAAV